MEGLNEALEHIHIKPGLRENSGKQVKAWGYNGVFNLLTSVSFPLILLVTWQIVSVLNIFPPMLVPSLKSVAENLAEQLKTGLLFSDLSVSLVRVMKGYFFGGLLGLSFGVFMGISAFANRFFSGIFDGIRQIPGLAWLPLIILWFGIGDTSKVVLIAKGTFFPVLLNTIDGIRNTDKGYLEVARLYGIKKLELIRKVYFPSAVPFVFVGLRLGAGMAWMSVVGAEMLASSSGLGYRISNAQQLMRSNELIVDMIVVGVIGWLVDLILRKITKKVLRWKK
ncbi:putative aliphatic sulfonates transport permease protein SsuC [Ruminiclostridium hungatei]|uniref:Putative aliphatic sulfonates transport permease protein SsuC n=1 Tax=Ruminiclostridium hungatei TaxID=48256 RepID=A0A1V4SIF6_RUMHU|nr:ABC transporter permease [Ruminiclostridium hungatei]OPX43286.1 putative aliphatic sulfonates transport permease protein SsuC [Ruminiclostridium hungatei]